MGNCHIANQLQRHEKKKKTYKMLFIQPEAAESLNTINQPKNKIKPIRTFLALLSTVPTNIIWLPTEETCFNTLSLSFDQFFHGIKCEINVCVSVCLVALAGPTSASLSEQKWS